MLCRLHTLFLAIAFLELIGLGSATRSSKRGLVYVPNSKHPDDGEIFVESGSDLTWYYNYGYAETDLYDNVSTLNFVPMLWGASDDDSTSTVFLDAVEKLLDNGRNITHVLAFNEPDGGHSTGGSNVPADLAASTWKRQIEPLRKKGVKVGAPAVTSAPTGFTWLQNFFTECAGECHPDFIPVHYYGNFEGLASHLGQVMATYPNMSEVWVTEFALAEEDLKTTQTFFNQSIEYLDRLTNITRYSYFGSFRSDVSNVGPNVAMLNQQGKLTDIGSWYLGGSATNVKPKGAAGRIGTFDGWTVVVMLAGLFHAGLFLAC
ncbi:glycosyl hydrolase catalytic core-domain-containing protein [Phyllosticta paracitricarpa]